jgi:hypothetical protein
VTAVQARPRPEPVAADILVLAGRRLQSGIDPASTARFGDDVWALSPAIHQLHTRALSLNFTTIPAPFRQVCKELFLAMLTLDLPTGLPVTHIVTIRGHFSAVKEFLAWADAHDIAALADLQAADLAGYDRHLRTQRVSAVTRERKQYTVRLFWLFRSKLHSDALSNDPALVLGIPYARPARRPAAENATDRIPEPVLAPLLVWALRWIEEFAEDILAADAHQRATADHVRLPVGQRGARQRLLEVLDGYRQRRQPLPGQGHPFPRRLQRVTAPGDAGPGMNLTRLAMQARCHPATLSRPDPRRLIADAASELGVDADTYLPITVGGHLDGRPWQPAIGTGELPGLARHLQTACYLVIASLSGMRDSEVKHLHRGCLHVWRDETGQPLRHKVTSLAFKGERTTEGVEATWVVGAPVARAVTVLERLQPDDQPLLFAVLPTSRGHGRAKANPVKTSQATNYDIAGFVSWIAGYCAVHARDDAVPDLDGRAWTLTTRQFRRTLAWFIARQPGGSIAGAIQYRHLSVQMFEGYAGTSTSGFRHEVEAEQALQRGEKLVDLATGTRPAQLVGPAADEARTRLTAFTAHFPGKVVNDRKRLQRLMTADDPNIHPGQYVTCVYNPDRALCHQDRPAADPGTHRDTQPGASAGPTLAHCRPTRCRNVTLTPANLQALTDWLTQIEALLAADDVLAPYVRDRLHQQAAEVTAMLRTQPPAAPAGDTLR